MDLKQIKTLRVQLGLTQSDLAKRSNMSQSFIAKVESGLIDPGYSKANKIIDVLHFERVKKQKTAKEIMSTKLILISPNQRADKAAKMLTSHSISQAPVAIKKKLLGLLSETHLLNAIADGKNLSELEVKSIMGPPPPVYDFQTSIDAITDALRNTSLVLVSKEGVLIGAITKTDILAK